MCQDVPRCVRVCQGVQVASPSVFQTPSGFTFTPRFFPAPGSSCTLEGSSPSSPLQPDAPGSISLFYRDGEGRGLVRQGPASQTLPAGCSDPALPSAPMPGSGGTPAPELRPLKRRPVPGEPSPAPGRRQRQPGQGQARRICVLAGKHYQCSSYGCKLAFASMQELMDHLKVHYRPTQSLEGKAGHPHAPFFLAGRGQSRAGGGRWEWGRHGRCCRPSRGAGAESLSELLCPGKTFHCPTLGCSETFPSMQDLMAHMKAHYKPNRYFK